MFLDALGVLAAQAGVAFVAEGEPLSPVLSGMKAQDLPSGTATLSATVAKLAAAYDYRAERRGNVFVLKKRYTDPKDLPGVTLEECRLSMRDALHLLAPFSPGFTSPAPSQDPRIKWLIASLTAEQLRAMADRPRGLPVAVLDARQQAQIWRFALHIYVQYPERDAKAALAQLDCVLDPKTTFGWGDQDGQRVFGYEGPLATARGPRVSFCPLLDQGTSAVAGPDGTLRLSLTNPPDAGATDSPVPLPAARRAALGTTLGAAVALLNARPGGAAKLAVDEALSAKPVTVVGAEAAPPAAVLRALADVYGLLVKEEKEEGGDVLRVTRYRRRAVTDVAGLPDALRRVFPEPLVRALRVDDLDAVRAQRRDDLSRTASKKAGETGADPPAMPLNRESGLATAIRHQERFRLQRQLGAAPDALRVAAVRLLKAGVEPRLKVAPGGRVALGALGGPERMALANALMADCLGQMRTLLGRNPPEYITRFAQTVLLGGVTKDEAEKPKFSLFLAQPPSPDGTISYRSAGFTADYVQ